MKPKVSFVVPVYNKCAYLSECLESLRFQTLSNIEIVVVDDGSFDSVDYLKNYYEKVEPKIKWYKLEQNKGRSYARNYGNDKAESDIIAVMDADDICFEERAKTIVKFFDKHPDIAVFYSSFHTVDFYGRIGNTVQAIPFDYEDVKKTRVTHMGHSTMAYRKKAVLDVKYDEGEYSRLGLDDWKLQLDLFHAGYKFGYADDILVCYRLLTDSISIVRSATEVYKAKGKYFDALEKLNKEKES